MTLQINKTFDILILLATLFIYILFFILFPLHYHIQVVAHYSNSLSFFCLCNREDILFTFEFLSSWTSSCCCYLSLCGAWHDELAGFLWLWIESNLIFFSNLKSNGFCRIWIFNDFVGFKIAEFLISTSLNSNPIDHKESPKQIP